LEGGESGKVLTLGERKEKREKGWEFIEATEGQKAKRGIIHFFVPVEFRSRCQHSAEKKRRSGGE
jgi:hypothetical protein